MNYQSLWRRLPWLAALVLSWFASAAFAQPAPQGDAEVDVSGRVAHISARQGEVVFAPDGEEEWIELPQNRPLVDGDRLWSDRGARAELHLDAATLHVGGETHVGISALNEKGTQLILEQGSLQARVRDLQQGENFEVDTPNVAVRMMQPGDYRVDVDEKAGWTRVTVLSGAVTVFGDGSQSVPLAAGQTASYSGRALAPAQAPAFRPDELAQWAADRNRAEEQSVSARHVPRGVVGYSQLDQHGDWQQAPEHGAVWYPRSVPENWAPYRQGRWTHVGAYGWTWVDEAPWGFAPFHYGRWAQINNRWAWVPGRLAPRPVYSPALVVFLGGGPSGGLVVRGGPGVGWYPLAPGEVWWPAFRASPRYFGGVNFGFNVRAYPRGYTNYYWARRPFAVTAVQLGDFRLGRPVYRGWAPLNAQVIARARIGFYPDRPNRVELRAVRGNVVVRLQARPARVQTVAGAHFAEKRRAEFRGTSAVAGRGGDGRVNRPPASGRGDGENGQQPLPRAVQRDQQRGGNDDRAGARPSPRAADNDRAGGRRGDDNDRAGGRRGDDNDRAGGRPSPRSENRPAPAGGDDRGARQGIREDRPGRGPEARDERGGGRGPEARPERPGRGPEARDERGGGRGPEAREQRQERPQARQEAPRQEARPQRAEPQAAPQPVQRPERAEAPRQQPRAEREQPQREQRGGGGGGRGRDRDEDERPRR